MKSRRTLALLSILFALSLTSCGNADGVVRFTIYLDSAIASTIDRLEVEIWSVDDSIIRGEKSFQDNYANTWKKAPDGVHVTDFTYVSNRDERIRAVLRVYKKVLNNFVQLGKTFASKEVRMQPGEILEVPMDMRTK